MWKFKSFCLDYWHVLCLHPHNNFYKRYVKKSLLIFTFGLRVSCCHSFCWLSWSASKERHINVFLNRLKRLAEHSFTMKLLQRELIVRVDAGYSWGFIGLLCRVNWCCHRREVLETVKEAWSKGIPRFAFWILLKIFLILVFLKFLPKENVELYNNKYDLVSR